MMKIRPYIWTTSFFVLALTVCCIQFASRARDAKPKEVPQFSQAEWDRYLARKAKYEFDKKNKYKAVANNGSKRSSLTASQLPEEIRSEAVRIANEYKQDIYPKLKAHIAKNGSLPTTLEVTDIPELSAYLKSPAYKGTGQKMLGHLSWTMGINWRLDGTMISNDVYSSNPPDALHDVWATNSKFVETQNGKPFLINGWDDGVVTFDLVENLFYKHRETAAGPSMGIAAPGQAGIPSDAKVQGAKIPSKPNN